MWNHRHLNVAGNTQLALYALLGSGGLFQLLVGCFQLVVGYRQILHVATATIEVEAEESDDEQPHADGCP